jgi:hypothetical protein
MYSQAMHVKPILSSVLHKLGLYFLLNFIACMFVSSPLRYLELPSVGPHSESSLETINQPVILYSITLCNGY